MGSHTLKTNESAKASRLVIRSCMIGTLFLESQGSGNNTYRDRAQSARCVDRIPSSVYVIMFCVLLISCVLQTYNSGTVVSPRASAYRLIDANLAVNAVTAGNMVPGMTSGERDLYVYMHWLNTSCVSIVKMYRVLNDNEPTKVDFWYRTNNELTCSTWSGIKTCPAVFCIHCIYSGMIGRVIHFVYNMTDKTARTRYKYANRCKNVTECSRGICDMRSRSMPTCIWFTTSIFYLQLSMLTLDGSTGLTTDEGCCSMGGYHHTFSCSASCAVVILGDVYVMNIDKECLVPQYRSRTPRTSIHMYHKWMCPYRQICKLRYENMLSFVTSVFIVRTCSLKNKRVCKIAIKNMPYMRIRAHYHDALICLNNVLPWCRPAKSGTYECIYSHDRLLSYILALQYFQDDDRHTTYVCKKWGNRAVRCPDAAVLVYSLGDMDRVIRVWLSHPCCRGAVRRIPHDLFVVSLTLSRIDWLYQLTSVHVLYLCRCIVCKQYMNILNAAMTAHIYLLYNTAFTVTISTSRYVIDEYCHNMIALNIDTDTISRIRYVIEEYCHNMMYKWTVCYTIALNIDATMKIWLLNKSVLSQIMLIHRQKYLESYMRYQFMCTHCHTFIFFQYVEVYESTQGASPWTVGSMNYECITYFASDLNLLNVNTTNEAPVYRQYIASRSNTKHEKHPTTTSAGDGEMFIGIIYEDFVLSDTRVTRIRCLSIADGAVLVIVVGLYENYVLYGARVSRCGWHSIAESATHETAAIAYAVYFVLYDVVLCVSREIGHVMLPWVRRPGSVKRSSSCELMYMKVLMICNVTVIYDSIYIYVTASLIGTKYEEYT